RRRGQGHRRGARHRGPQAPVERAGRARERGHGTALNDTPKDGVVAAPGAGPLGPAEAAIFETFVVPRYLSWFGELALEMVAESDDAQVVHLHCRTGYPDRAITLKLPNAHVIGLDTSSAALELARAK